MSTASAAAADATAAAPTALYDRVVAVLRERYFDRSFRERELEAMAARYRPEAECATTLRAQSDAVTKFLSRIPASHLALFLQESFDYLIGELSGAMRPTFGLQLLRTEAGYFTFFVLEGGAAARAGILPWERVLAIDNTPVAQSERLDYQQKDAFLSIERDPPIHSILCREDDEITLLLERTPGDARAVRLLAANYSALAAARASARMIETDGRKIASVHFWFIHSSGVLELLRELFAGLFAEADGLLLDLRGRGGNAVVVQPLLEMLQAWGRPIVALTDRQSRSAKDALASSSRNAGWPDWSANGPRAQSFRPALPRLVKAAS